MKIENRYLFLSVFLSALSIYLSYPILDFALIIGVIVINILTRELYNMNVKKIWYAGAAVFVDENSGKNMSHFFLKKPLMVLYIVAIGFTVFGHLFMQR